MLHESIKAYLAQKGVREIASGMYLFSEVMHVLRLGNYTYYTKKLRLQKLQAIGKVVYQISIEQIIELIIPHYREADIYEMVNTPCAPMTLAAIPHIPEFVKPGQFIPLDSPIVPIPAAQPVPPKVEEVVRKTFAPIVKQELRPNLIRQADDLEIIDPCGERTEPFIHRIPVGETEQVLTLYLNDTLMKKNDIHFIINEKAFTLPLETYMQWKLDVKTKLTSIDDIFPGQDLDELVPIGFPRFAYSQKFLENVGSLNQIQKEESIALYRDVIIPKKIKEHDEDASLPEGVTFNDMQEVERVIATAYSQAEFEIGIHQSPEVEY